ncbi:MAG: hypothetical protein M3155_05795 [Actinomycetota bacterium]|nr:hypothetical protein [Actinomycetota bacterium]
MASSIDELAYDLSLAAIRQQETRLNELRARTGTLLAAAAVAASFFGARAAGGAKLDVLGFLALLAFACCSASGLYVLLPHQLVLEFRGSVLHEAAGKAQATLEDAHAAATEWIEGFHAANRYTLGTLTGWYTAAVVALGVEIVLWTLSVSGTLTE